MAQVKVKTDGIHEFWPSTEEEAATLYTMCGKGGTITYKLMQGSDTSLPGFGMYLEGSNRNTQKKTRTPIVCLCGSTRFRDVYLKAQREESLAGKIVLTVGLFGHLEDFDMAGEDKVRLDELHLRKIDLADEVLFLNVDGYMGTSTLAELRYARSTKKVIRFLEPQP